MTTKQAGDAIKRRGPRVAFILSSLGAGGAERVVALISKSIVEAGGEATIIAFDSPSDPVFHTIDSRIQLRRLDLPAGTRGLRAVDLMGRRVLKLRRTLLTGRFDVAVSFLTKINALVLLAATGLSLPVIVSERNNPLQQQRHNLWDPLLTRLYSRASQIVLQTERARGCLPVRERCRAIVIPNPIVPPAIIPRGAGLHMVAGVGRLVPQKGFDLLIEAFACIAADFPQWSLSIWGEGPERAALASAIDSFGLQERIRLPGNSEAPGTWGETATLLVLSSRFEGFPNVIGEAMALGIPVIAADCDFGPAELIEHDVNGLLAPPENVAALAQAMRRAMVDADLRNRLANAAKTRVNSAESDHVINTWLELIWGQAGEKLHIE